MGPNTVNGVDLQQRKIALIDPYNLTYRNSRGVCLAGPGWAVLGACCPTVRCGSKNPCNMACPGMNGGSLELMVAGRTRVGGVEAVGEAWGLGSPVCEWRAPL
jgi:hypothetical protein